MCLYVWPACMWVGVRAHVYACIYKLELALGVIRLLSTYFLRQRLDPELTSRAVLLASLVHTSFLYLLSAGTVGGLQPHSSLPYVLGTQSRVGTLGQQAS